MYICACVCIFLNDDLKHLDKENSTCIIFIKVVLFISHTDLVFPVFSVIILFK